MDVKRAKQIIEETKVDYLLGDRILSGLNIINKYNRVGEIISGAEHDLVYSVSFESTVERMSESDVTYLAVRGWFEKLGGWAHHV